MHPKKRTIIVPNRYVLVSKSRVIYCQNYIVKAIISFEERLNERLSSKGRKLRI